MRKREERERGERGERKRGGKEKRDLVKRINIKFNHKIEKLEIDYLKNFSY